ncbi:MAG: hypothetical protein CVV22_10765 [Ignavibacteriae bacterium HGW-Ignavibacteriae-1]|nr:MAG: hypothetical protein CVV22_10765 [Ignavibacteriae bacterium HGW-Ignavibacteriae-1]
MYTFNDSEILNIIYKGSKRDIEQAYRFLYAKYSKMIHAYCACIIKDKDLVEDIFQETFIRFYNAVTQEKTITNIPGFLTITSRNLCYNAIRSRKNNVELDENMLVDRAEDKYEKKEMLEIIISAVEFIDEKYRTPFMLREFEGLSYSEIAELLNITADNAKVKTTRAKKMIIKVLQPYLKDISN